MITLCTCIVQTGPFSEAIESHCGKGRKSLTEAKVDQTVRGGEMVHKENYSTCQNNSQEHSGHCQWVIEASRVKI